MLDVPFGGLLLSLPALLSCGLVKDIDQHFSLPKGYYGLMSIFTLLAFMALARIQSLESLRYHAPGEWGKVLGLDRIPEVKTLRSKIKYLSHHGKVEEWGSVLCKEWMSASDEMLGALAGDSFLFPHGPDATLDIFAEALVLVVQLRRHIGAEVSAK